MVAGRAEGGVVDIILEHALTCALIIVRMGGNSCVHIDHLAFQRLFATLPHDLMLRLIVFAGHGRALSRFLNDGYVAQNKHGVNRGATAMPRSETLGWSVFAGWLPPDKMKKRAHDRDTGPRHRMEDTVEQYIGLDVSLKDTSISIRQEGRRIWRGTCPSDPKLLAEVIRKRAPGARRVVFETGPLAVWFYHALTAEGLPAICIDARHAKAALDMAPK
jgi:hypothetical protein